MKRPRRILGVEFQKPKPVQEPARFHCTQCERRDQTYIEHDEHGTYVACRCFKPPRNYVLPVCQACNRGVLTQHMVDGEVIVLCTVCAEGGPETQRHEVALTRIAPEQSSSVLLPQCIMCESRNTIVTELGGGVVPTRWRCQDCGMETHYIRGDGRAPLVTGPHPMPTPEPDVDAASEARPAFPTRRLTLQCRFGHETHIRAPAGRIQYYCEQCREVYPIPPALQVAAQAEVSAPEVTDRGLERECPSCSVRQVFRGNGPMYSCFLCGHIHVYARARGPEETPEMQQHRIDVAARLAARDARVARREAANRGPVIRDNIPYCPVCAATLSVPGAGRLGCARCDQSWPDPRVTNRGMIDIPGPFSIIGNVLQYTAQSPIDIDSVVLANGRAFVVIGYYQDETGLFHIEAEHRLPVQEPAPNPANRGLEQTFICHRCNGTEIIRTEEDSIPILTCTACRFRWTRDL